MTNDGNIISNPDTGAITVNQPGIYFYEILNPTNFCSTKGQVTVAANSVPPTIAFEVPEFLTCERATVQIDATGSANGGQFSINWVANNGGNVVSGGNGLQPVVDEPGLYFLEINNIFNGCSSIDSIEIFELQNDISELITSIFQPECDSLIGSIQIEDVSGSFPPFEFSIDGNNFSNQTNYENLPEGIYEIFVRDSIGCEFSDSIELIAPSPFQIQLIPEITLTIGEERQLNVQTSIADDEIASVEWFPAENLSCVDCLNPTVTGQNELEYTVRVTDLDGCVSEATIFINIEDMEEPVDDNDIFFPSGFSPNNDGINDVFSGFSNSSKVAQIETLQIFDRWGNKVYEGNNGSILDFNFGWDGTYNDRLMDAGVYLFFAKVELMDGRNILVKGDITLSR